MSVDGDRNLSLWERGRVLYRSGSYVLNLRRALPLLTSANGTVNLADCNRCPFIAAQDRVRILAESFVSDTNVICICMWRSGQIPWNSHGIEPAIVSVLGNPPRNTHDLSLPE